MNIAATAGKTNLANIPAELREPTMWLQYYLSADPKKPGKKPRKHPCVKYATSEDRIANLRSLDYLLSERPPQAGVQRLVDKDEGFTFIDIDRVRDLETGEVQGWARDLIRELDTYCEVSASGKGFHLVVRGTVPKDFHKDPDQVEIYGGNIPNKLIAMTGDIEELYTDIANGQEQITALLRRAEMREFNKEAPSASGVQFPADDQPDPTHWREVFHTGSELDQRPARVFIKGILEEGITAIGSLSGVGKTWVGLSISHAVITKEPLFGRFPVVERVNVLYLVPEMGGRKFRERLVKMRIPQDGSFFCQTVTDGACDLADPFLLQAVEDMRPLVILDTAIRFQRGEENSSTDQAQGLGASIFNLISHGAASVVCMHHRAKAAGANELTLENALRGSGDFGAMADCVWGLDWARLNLSNSDDDRKKRRQELEYLEDSQHLTRLYLKCVKPRDMEPEDPFKIQGRPYIDDTGDFVVVPSFGPFGPASGDVADSTVSDADILRLIEENTSIRKIRTRLGVGNGRIYRVAKEKGWRQNAEGKWEPSLGAA